MEKDGKTTDFLQGFDKVIKLVIAEKRDITTDTYLRNRLTLLLYKLDHKEMLTKFETIVLIEISIKLSQRLLSVKSVELKKGGRILYGKEKS